MMDFNERAGFLNTAGLFEGGLVLLALFLGWLAGIDPLAVLPVSPVAAVWGIVAAVPMFALFLLSLRWQAGPLVRIKRLLVELLGPPLAACKWYDLVLLALLVGFAEELFFRGLLQQWIELPGGYTAGLIGSNVLFGLAHCVTPMYGLLAGATGVYLGWLFDATGERNLLVPIAAHALYDHLAFLSIARIHRERTPESHIGD